MKKTVAFFLVLALFLALAACSAPNQSTDGNSVQGATVSKDTPMSNETLSVPKPALSELGDGKREDAILILQVTINPEFELYVDFNNQITAVRCLNEDAEKLFAGKDILGMEVGKGLKEAMAEAQNQGFLNETVATVTIAPTVQNGLDWSEELSEVLASYVADFAESAELPELISNIVPPEITDTDGFFDELLTAQQSKYFSQGPVWDLDGNEIGIVKTYGDDEGNVIKIIYEYNDGSTTTKNYSNGVIISEHAIWDYMVSDTTYNEAGNPVHSVTRFSDGVTEETQYYENGCIKCKIINGTDYSAEEHYNESGSIAFRIYSDSNMTEETTYQADGSSAGVTSYADGTYSEWQRDAEGNINMIYNKSSGPNGEVIEETGGTIIVDGKELDPNSEEYLLLKAAGYF